MQQLLRLRYVAPAVPTAAVACCYARCFIDRHATHPFCRQCNTCSWEKEQEDAKADKARRAELETELDSIQAVHSAAIAALDVQLVERQAALNATQAAFDASQVGRTLHMPVDSITPQEVA